MGSDGIEDAVSPINPYFLSFGSPIACGRSFRQKVSKPELRVSAHFTRYNVVIKALDGFALLTVVVLESGSSDFAKLDRERRKPVSRFTVTKP
jgi:hypothetical protein